MAAVRVEMIAPAKIPHNAQKRTDSTEDCGPMAYGEPSDALTQGIIEPLRREDDPAEFPHDAAALTEAYSLINAMLDDPRMDLGAINPGVRSWVAIILEYWRTKRLSGRELRSVPPNLRERSRIATVPGLLRSDIRSGRLAVRWGEIYFERERSFIGATQ